MKKWKLKFIIFFKKIYRKAIKKIVRISLLSFSKIILRKYKPLIVGITGSMGKTIATRFIAKVLKSKYEVLETEYEEKTLLTIPLTILRIKAEPSTKNLFYLLTFIFIKFLRIILLPYHYPKILVLEFRADVSRGEKMKKLIKILKPKFGVITAIEPTHLIYFKNIQNIINAKRSLVELLPSSGFAILNYDDKRVKDMAQFTKAKVIFYGLNSKADIHASRLTVSTKGLNFTLNYRKTKRRVTISKIINKYHIYGVLAAVAVGILNNINFEKIIKEIKKLSPPTGRGNIVKGIKNTVIINDAFNANLKSTKAALETLGTLAGRRRKIAVLGDMLQLDKYSKKTHQEIGKKVVKEKIDTLITVGRESKIIAKEAKKRGLALKNIFQATKVETVLPLLKSILKKDDVILLKGSHDMGLYKLIKDLKSTNL